MSRKMVDTEALDVIDSKVVIKKDLKVEKDTILNNLTVTGNITLPEGDNFKELWLNRINIGGNFLTAEEKVYGAIYFFSDKNLKIQENFDDFKNNMLSIDDSNFFGYATSYPLTNEGVLDYVQKHLTYIKTGIQRFDLTLSCPGENQSFPGRISSNLSLPIGIEQINNIKLI